MCVLFPTNPLEERYFRNPMGPKPVERAGRKMRWPWPRGCVWFTCIWRDLMGEVKGYLLYKHVTFCDGLVSIDAALDWVL